MLVLLLGAMDMLIRNDYSLELKEFSLVSCNIHKFLTHTVTYVSSFISVAVNVDRAQIVAGISMFNMGNINGGIKNNTLNKRRKKNVRLNKRFVDYIVCVIVVSIVVLNLHYVTFMKTSSIIYVDFEENDSNENNSKMCLNASLLKNPDEKLGNH